MDCLTVGILGGSFNPITIGHIQTASSATNLAQDENYNAILDEVWFMPCAEHTFGKQLLDSQTRVKMMELALEGFAKFRICKYEIQNQSTGSTYDTLVKFNNNLKALPIDFYYIIGSDNSQTMERWINYKKLIEEFKFIVVSRPGYDVADWAKQEPHIITPIQQMKNISSTMVREFATNKDYESMRRYVSPKVANMIEANKLYAEEGYVRP